MSEEQEKITQQESVRLQRQQEQHRLRLRQNALEIAEFEHGDDKDLVKIKKRMVDLQADMQKRQMEVRTLQVEYQKIVDELSEALEPFISEKLRINKTPTTASATKEDCGCAGKKKGNK